MPFVELMEKHVFSFGAEYTVINPDLTRWDEIVDFIVTAFGKIYEKQISDNPAVDNPDLEVFAIGF